MMDHFVCTLQELVARRVVSVDLGRNAAGRPTRGLVAIDGMGEIVAYQDLCRHLPVFLDASERFLSDDKRHLVCMTHGALYRISDGMCVEGPCEGLALHALPLRMEEGQIWVAWSPAE